VTKDTIEIPALLRAARDAEQKRGREDQRNRRARTAWRTTRSTYPMQPAVRFCLSSAVDSAETSAYPGRVLFSQVRGK
jgi:hypothetical protein